MMTFLATYTCSFHKTFWAAVKHACEFISLSLFSVGPYSTIKLYGMQSFSDFLECYNQENGLLFHSSSSFIIKSANTKYLSMKVS